MNENLNLYYKHFNKINNILYNINNYNIKKIEGSTTTLDLNKYLGYKHSLEIMSAFYPMGSNEFYEILKVYNKLITFIIINFNYEPNISEPKFVTYEDTCTNPYNKFLANKTKRLA